MKKSKLLMPLAGIATIGAVAPIVTLASCSNGDFVNAADTAFLTKINGYMKYGNTYVAPHKAIEALKDMDLNPLSFRLSNASSEFAFDVNAKKFIIMNGDTVAAAPDGYSMADANLVFKFTSNYDKNSKYGQYLMDNYNWTTPAEVFEVKTSIDVGNNTNIKNIKYVGDSNNAKNVLLRTYCENLTVQAQKDTIYHAGESNNIDVNYLCSNTCTYTELGKVAYMYAENTKLNLAQIDTIDKCQIDVLETGKGVSKGDLFHEEMITMLIGEEVIDTEEFKTLEYTDIEEVTNSEELWDAIDSGKTFIRLTANIDLNVTSTITITDKSFILDLAGCTLTDKSTNLTSGEHLIDIQATDKDSSLMFIDSWRSGAFVLNNHNVNVVGNTDSNENGIATLYLEGANITYNCTTNRTGAITAGNYVASPTTLTTTGHQYSRVIMYGGIIKANTSSETHTVEASGIYGNLDAYIQVNYGAIYASTNCIRTNGRFDGTYIDIFNGTFKNTNANYGECIYLPQGKLNIWGGNFEGHCCIAIRGGHTNIAGGYFHATGTYKDINPEKTGQSGLESDGSVICVELCYNPSSVRYGLNPSLTVTNATLQSDNSYIMQLVDEPAPATVEPTHQYFEADFFGGVYYFGKDLGTSAQFTGMKIDKIYQNLYRISQQGGTWVNTEKY